jgi:RHS repeat-associated protein
VINGQLVCGGWTTAATATKQYYTPYGTTRGVDTITATTRAFLGQHQDTTGLNHLNNRHHDLSTGTFLSVDPIVASTGEPYIYASAKPTTSIGARPTRGV